MAILLFQDLNMFFRGIDIVANRPNLQFDGRGHSGRCSYFVRSQLVVLQKWRISISIDISESSELCQRASRNK